MGANVSPVLEKTMTQSASFFICEENAVDREAV